MGINKTPGHCTHIAVQGRLGGMRNEEALVCGSCDAHFCSSLIIVLAFEYLIVGSILIAVGWLVGRRARKELPSPAWENQLALQGSCVRKTKTEPLHSLPSVDKF